MPDDNSSNVEEIYIPPEEKRRKIELRQVL